MSEEFSAQKHPTAIWNPARGVWEKAGTASLLCEHLERFSETWPTSGTMRNGRVYERRMPAHPITDSEFSSSPIPESSKLRTPSAIEGEGGAISEKQSRERGRMLQVRDQMAQLAAENGLKVPDSIAESLLPTTRAQHGEDRNNRIWARDPKQPQNLENALHAVLPTPQTMDTLPARTGEARERQLRRGGSESRRSSSGNLREDILEMLPTPVASEGTKAPAQQTSETKSKTGQVWLSNVAKDMEPLLPTTRTSMKNGATTKEVEAGNPKHRLEAVTNWGKFEAAIRRWEKTIGREAPAPTKPDGKDGAHRLSSAFTEWMMGLPAGWITDVGLSRNDELKACGNGVVPQQAEMALRILLQGGWRRL